MCIRVCVCSGVCVHVYHRDNENTIDFYCAAGVTHCTAALSRNTETHPDRDISLNVPLRPQNS